MCQVNTYCELAILSQQLIFVDYFLLRIDTDFIILDLQAEKPWQWCMRQDITNANAWLFSCPHLRR